MTTRERARCCGGAGGDRLRIAARSNFGGAGGGGDVVVLGEFYGNVLGFDVATGRELWRFPRVVLSLAEYGMS